jgi:hypothetical protein
MVSDASYEVSYRYKTAGIYIYIYIYIYLIYSDWLFEHYKASYFYLKQRFGDRIISAPSVEKSVQLGPE